MFLGSDTSPPTITVNGNGNAFEVAGDSVFSGTVSTNTINSEGNNDLVFQRNGSQVMKLNSGLDVELSGGLYLNGLNK